MNRSLFHSPRSRTYGSSRPQRAQTLVFFTISLTTIILLCGLAIDSGLLYLAKARISRAVDGAALAAVGNFHQSDDPATNRQLVAKTLRNFATANYTDLGTVNATATENQINPTTYQFNFFDPAPPAQDPNGAYRRFVQVTLTVGAGGQITSAQCNARCPVNTYFIGFFSNIVDLKVSSAAQATRNPRLIMVVVDRSGSMLVPPTGGGNPGAVGLAPAIVTFLNFFDTSSDYIGLVSFASNARLEMPLTTNFLYAATNDLADAYDITTNMYPPPNGSTRTWYVPGPDPEYNTPNYNTQGVRRFRFGGDTAADEGIRLALEQMMANTGWSNPNVVKYMVIFTDGAWNTTRTLVAAPGYTNIVYGPPLTALPGENIIGTNSAIAGVAPFTAYRQLPAMGTWTNYFSSIATNAYYASVHTNDHLQSLGAWDVTNEANNVVTSQLPGAPQTYTTDTFLTNIGGLTPVYTSNISVWVPPGSVDYTYRLGFLSKPETVVSEINNPGKNVQINLGPGDYNALVVPGYIIDGIVYDGFDLGYKSYDPPNSLNYVPTLTTFRQDNFVAPWVWPDADPASMITSGADGGTGGTGGSNSGAYTSKYRNLMFANYMNLLTGYYVFRPDDPLGTGIEPLTGALRPLNPVGRYYPSAAFYWPFDDVGLDQYPTWSLRDPTHTDPSVNGMSRGLAYSINMLSSNAAPEWSGELFYHGQNGVLSTTASQSSLMTSKSDWQTGIPTWVTGAFDNGGGITTTDSAHNTVQLADAKVWRPISFNGSNSVGIDNTVSSLNNVVPNDSQNKTGGYVIGQDGTTIYRNTMCWSGRPTHYYDFSKSTWVPVITNHIKNQQMLPLGNWKASEYCWHARAAGVTIYTVGYGSAVSPAENTFLAELANATNGEYTPGVYPGTNFLPANYNTQQPIGKQFYATNSDQIGVDFSNVATAINAALTQ